MVINHCTLYKLVCMIHHFNQNVTADAKMYHTCLYVKCTMIYDHICTQFWRSVSASGHGNVIFNTFPRETRVRSPDPNRYLCTGGYKMAYFWQKFIFRRKSTKITSFFIFRKLNCTESRYDTFLQVAIFLNFYASDKVEG